MRTLQQLGIGIALATLTVGVNVAQATEALQGKVVSAGNGMISFQPAQGPAMTLVVSRDATITRNGKTASLDALKADDAVTVTMDNKMAVMQIEARAPGNAPPPPMKY